jgi:hypothetical protein
MSDRADNCRPMANLGGRRVELIDVEAQLNLFNFLKSLWGLIMIYRPLTRASKKGIGLEISLG